MSLRCVIIGVGISSFLLIIQFEVENAWEYLENGGKGVAVAVVMLAL
jgi:hypothetical protein